MINKIANTQLSTSFVWAIFLAIVLIIFFFSGGINSFSNIFKALSQIPTWVWIIFGLIFLVKLMTGGKRRR